MEKKWRPVWQLSAQVLCFLLCVAPQTDAKVKAKSKARVMLLHAGHVSAPRASYQERLHSRSPRHEKFAKRVVVSRHSQSTIRQTAHLMTVPGKKGKILVVRDDAPRAFRSTMFRRRTTAMAFSTRWRERRVVWPFAHRSPAHEDGESSTRQVLIENNYTPADVGAAYFPDAAPFPMRVNGEPLLYRFNSVFALPGETLTFVTDGAEKRREYALQTQLAVAHVGPNSWSWKAPREVGVYPVKVLQPNGGVVAQVNVFVMLPFPQLEAGYMNGYRIGRYPTTPFKQLATYELPRGFIEVTESNQDARVSPHFRLRQFLCKQESDFPKYIVLDPRLLDVLETVLKKVNERGYACPTLSVMSGYRTPFYNRAIGNVTTYSRHLWGDAADIFIDAHPVDGEMDDLNRDGVVNIRDTQVLYDIVYNLYEPQMPRFLTSGLFYEPRLQHLLANGTVEDQQVQRLMTGGLARYRETGAHGPFVHVDVRGVFTRWGQ